MNRRTFLSRTVGAAAAMVALRSSYADPLLAGSRVLHLDADATSQPTTAPARPWLGVHLLISSDRNLQQLLEQLPKLAKLGVNALIAEISYSFAFASHPELRNDSVVTPAVAKTFARACREHGIRPIPQFNCLGHQSWKGATFPLLTKHPEFDETPGQFPKNTEIYCRSWCPQHPDVNAVVCALIDEQIDAFETDAFHVGMDEVFLVASEHCPRCKGKDPAEMFAKAVNDLHAHIVKKRGVEMLMWSDRLLDAKSTGYGEWEAAKNGTSAAIDLIPKDIVQCDWHYERRKSYPSIPLLIDKGFRVWPTGWNKEDATAALIDDEQRHAGPKMVGHLCSTWGSAKLNALSEYPPIVLAAERWRTPREKV